MQLVSLLGGISIHVSELFLTTKLTKGMKLTREVTAQLEGSNESVSFPSNLRSSEIDAPLKSVAVIANALETIVAWMIIESTDSGRAAGGRILCTRFCLMPRT